MKKFFTKKVVLIVAAALVAGIAAVGVYHVRSHKKPAKKSK